MKLYDREVETQILYRLLSGHEPRSICILGDSGVGKSVLVSKCIAASDLRVITFSFKEQVDTEASSFTNFIIGLNKTHSASFLGRFTYLNLKDIKINFPGFSVGYDVNPEALDGVFFEYLFEKLRRSGYQALRIENLELCRNPRDIQLLLNISKIEEPNLKIIYEIGTLKEIDNRLRPIEIMSSYRKVFSLKHLDEGKTFGLYRFMHEEEPPPEIFKQTNGLPLAVRHRANIHGDDSGLIWIERKIELLDSPTYQLVYALSTLEEPCSTDDLEQVYLGADFQMALMNAVRHDVICADTMELKFTHPSFRVVLQRKSVPYLDRNILEKTLAYRISKSTGAPDHELPIISIAQRLGDHATVYQRTFNLLTEAYASQNAPLLRYLCDVLLNGANLSKRQRRTLLMLKILSLCGLSIPDKAEKILYENAAVLAADKRCDVLRAMVSYQKNQFALSNQIIAEALAAGNLDDRSIAVSLSVKIANDIPEGAAESALAAFEDAMALAIAKDMDDLREEFIRLYARLTPAPLLAIERMRDFNSQCKGSNEIARARLLHNLGVLEMVTTDAACGGEHLKLARSVFTKYDLNYAAYSAATQAIIEVATGRIDDAISLLIDAKCLCREQYDLCAVINNYAACLLVAGEYEKCLTELIKMEEALTSPQPLGDPIICAALHENRALAYLKLQNFSAARIALNKAPGIKFPSFSRERGARALRLRQAIEYEDASFPVVNERYEPGALPYNKFNATFLTLSFFDYPFSLFSKEEIEALPRETH